MIRLLGILTGSAVAIGVLIVVVGVPELVDDPARRIEASTAAPPMVTAEAPAPETAPPAMPAVRASEPPALPAIRESEPPAPPAEPPSAPVPAPDGVQQNAAVPEPEARQTPEPESAAAVPEAVVAESPDELRWFAFWSPFRSQIAANGFVAQLQRVTGLDYRVVHVRPGVYEVAFAYADDAEIEAKLSEISAATGLEVPES